MPKVNDVAYLIQTIGNKDYARARSLIEAMVANERGNGREQAAKSLEYALRNWPNTNLIELPHAIKSVVWAEEPKFSLDELWLDEQVKNEVESFIKERANIEKLRDAGLYSRNKILLAGPPGNGKTSLAEALAKELNLSFLSIKLHETISSHLGETSAKIGKLLEYALFNNCLVFLDELDCLGSSRTSGAESSGKEYNTIVNSLLMNIDRLPDTSIIVGATNRPDDIDNALERRFNIKLWLGFPDLSRIESYVLHYQNKHKITFNRQGNEPIKLVGKPWSSVTEFCLNRHRELVLGESFLNQAEWVGR